jgi:hypothetical protein
VTVEILLEEPIPPNDLLAGHGKAVVAGVVHESDTRAMQAMYSPISIRSS